jgi:hypothetical protein
VIFEAVVVAHNLGLAAHRKQALHTGLERNPGEVVGPTVVRTVVVGAVQAVHMVVVHIEMEVDHMGVAVVRKEAAGAVQAAHMEVEVDHTEVALPNLAGLDHKTWIIPSCRVLILPYCTIQGNGITILQVWRQTVKFRLVYV